MTEALLIALLIVGIANLALVILLISGRRDAAREIDRLKRDMLDEQRALRAEVSENPRRSINAVGETLLNEYQRDTLNQEQRFKTFALENAQRMEQIRRSVERQLADIREDNGKKLGTLVDVMQTGANDVFVVKMENGKEVLLPVIKDCVLDINAEEKKIVVHMMNGLLN